MMTVKGKENCPKCGQVDVVLLAGQCLECHGLTPGSGSELGEKAQALRGQLMKVSDWEAASAIANCVLDHTLKHFNHHMAEGNVATSLLARSMVANALVVVASEWWADVQKDAMKADTYAVVRDLVINPPAEFGTRCWTDEGEER